MNIPYAATPRPDTGVTNATLGLWLFLASETMLFGSLFSAYAILRNGAVDWPAESAIGSLPLGLLGTALLVAGSAAMIVARRAVRQGSMARCRTASMAAVACGLVFLAVKFVDYSDKAGAGIFPSSSNAVALFYVLTGLHALHVAGGVAAIGFVSGPGARLATTNPPRFAERIHVLATYWHFVDVVWLALLVIFYLR